VTVRPAEDLVEDVVALGSRDVGLLRPRDAESLLDERAFEREELMPYWAQLWPSSVALALAVSPRSWKGARILELGCGLGLPSIAAALGGARVLATDWSVDALEMVTLNAARNEATVAVARCDWVDAQPALAGAPWRLVLASDVLYEARNIDLLSGLLPRLVNEGGELWLADPGRPRRTDFLSRAEEHWMIDTISHGGPPMVTVHRLRRRRLGP